MNPWIVILVCSLAFYVMAFIYLYTQVLPPGDGENYFQYSLRRLFRDLAAQSGEQREEIMRAIRKKIRDRIDFKYWRKDIFTRILKEILIVFKMWRVKSQMASVRFHAFFFWFTWEEVQDVITCFNNATADYAVIVADYYPPLSPTERALYWVQDLIEKSNGAKAFFSRMPDVLKKYLVRPQGGVPVKDLSYNNCRLVETGMTMDDKIEMRNLLIAMKEVSCEISRP